MILSGIQTRESIRGTILKNASTCACRLYFGSARHAVVCRAVDQKETEVETEVTELTISNPETKKTTGTNFELELERFLFNTRYLAFIGVVVQPLFQSQFKKVTALVFQGSCFLCTSRL